MSPTFTNRYFARLQDVRGQLRELITWAGALPSAAIVDTNDVVRLNDVLLLTRKLISREKTVAFVQLLSHDRPVTAAAASLALAQASGAVKVFVRRHGHYERELEEWLLPGERLYVEKRDDDGFDDEGNWR